MALTFKASNSSISRDLQNCHLISRLPKTGKMNTPFRSSKDSIIKLTNLASPVRTLSIPVVTSHSIPDLHKLKRPQPTNHYTIVTIVWKFSLKPSSFMISTSSHLLIPLMTISSALFTMSIKCFMNLPSHQQVWQLAFASGLHPSNL